MRRTTGSQWTADFRCCTFIEVSILGAVQNEPGLNLVPWAHAPFGQHQDMELWNNQFPETKILGLPVSRRMRGLVYMASRDKVDVDAFHKGIQYALEKLGKSKFGFERTTTTTVSNSGQKQKDREGSGIFLKLCLLIVCIIGT